MQLVAFLIGISFVVNASVKGAMQQEHFLYLAGTASSGSLPEAWSSYSELESWAKKNVQGKLVRISAPNREIVVLFQSFPSGRQIQNFFAISPNQGSWRVFLSHAFVFDQDLTTEVRAECVVLDAKTGRKLLGIPDYKETFLQPIVPLPRMEPWQTLDELKGTLQQRQSAVEFFHLKGRHREILVSFETTGNSSAGKAFLIFEKMQLLSQTEKPWRFLLSHSALCKEDLHVRQTPSGFNIESESGTAILFIPDE